MTCKSGGNGRVGDGGDLHAVVRLFKGNWYGETRLPTYLILWLLVHHTRKSTRNHEGETELFPRPGSGNSRSPKATRHLHKENNPLTPKSRRRRLRESWWGER